MLNVELIFIIARHRSSLGSDAAAFDECPEDFSDQVGDHINATQSDEVKAEWNALSWDAKKRLCVQAFK